MKRVLMILALCLSPLVATAEEEDMSSSICTELNESIRTDIDLVKTSTDAEVIEYLTDSILVKVKAGLVLGCECSE